MPVAKVVDVLYHCIEVKGIIFLLLAPAQRELDVRDGSLETLYDGVRVTKDVGANGTGVLTHVAVVAATNRRGSSRRRGHRVPTSSDYCVVLFLLFMEHARTRAGCRRGSDGVDFNQPILGSWVPFRLLRPRCRSADNQLMIFFRNQLISAFWPGSLLFFSVVGVQAS